MSQTKRDPNHRYLSDPFIKTVQPDTTRTLYWDTKQPGLVLSVESTGHKAFKLIYSFLGRSRWYTIGPVTQLGLKEARQMARDRLADVYRGRDIQAERRAARGAGTFEELAERYREEHAKLRNKSWRQADTLVHNHLAPKWGKLPAHKIARADVRAVFNKITHDGSPVLANQVLAAASAIFSWALKNEVGGIEINPCSNIDRNPTKARERVLSDRELSGFWAAFDDAGLIRSCALRLILLTGQRPGEVRHMRWKDIEDGWWTLPGDPDDSWPGTKNGQTHRVWLAKPAREILSDLSDGQGEGLVCPGSRNRAISGLDEAMRIICNSLGVNEKVTPHDLRRTHGTTVTSLGFTRDQMNRLQNHKEGGIGSVYDRHSYADENRRIQEAVATRIMGLVIPSQAEEPLKVVAF